MHDETVRKREDAWVLIRLVICMKTKATEYMLLVPQRRILSTVHVTLRSRLAYASGPSQCVSGGLIVSGSDRTRQDGEDDPYESTRVVRPKRLWPPCEKKKACLGHSICVYFRFSSLRKPVTSTCHLEFLLPSFP